MGLLLSVSLLFNRILFSLNLIYIVPVYSGGSQEVDNLASGLTEFQKTFEKPSEYLNPKEFVSDEIARSEIIDGIENKIKESVDELLTMEIKNLRQIFTKGKRDPKIPKKKPKIKVVAEKMGPGEKPLAKIPVDELLTDVITSKVFRKMVPKDLNDLIGDFNYISNSMQLVDEKLIDIPIFYTKQLIKELCIYPLGCKLVKKESKFQSNSILFHGGTGSGKTHAALAIAYHTDALFFDISPSHFERLKITGKKRSDYCSSIRF